MSSVTTLLVVGDFNGGGEELTPMVRLAWWG